MSVSFAGLAGKVGAEPWSIEPKLGVSADYATNPLLREFGGVAEEHIAGLIDLPLRYDTDGIDFMVRPSGRISNSSGYASLASNYEHVDSNVQFSSDLGATVIQAGWARDSSLYYIGALVNGLGVRRDIDSTSADWSRAVTERSEIELDASWTRVRYDQLANLNYRRFRSSRRKSPPCRCLVPLGAINRSTALRRVIPRTSSWDSCGN